MHVVQRLLPAHLPIALLLGLGLLPGCLPGERANDPLTDVVADTGKADTGKNDAKVDGQADGATDAALDGADDATGVDDDVPVTGDIATLGCKADADCAVLPALPCHATPTCALDTGLCAYALLDVDTPCVTDKCLTGQKCDATGACAGGSALNCADDPVKSPCTLDSCNNGVCAHTVSVNVPCLDGNPCTFSDHCNADGTCTGTQVLPYCDDHDPCTTDSCNPSGDTSTSITGLCTHTPFAYVAATPIACSGNAAGYLGFCDKGTCGIAADCDDKNPCTDDNFDDVQGKCTNTFIPGNVVCGSDKCNPGTCKLVAGTDGVDLPTCVTSPLCTTTKVCMTVKCNPANGTCGSPTPLAKGAACGDLCLSNGTCDGNAKPVCTGTTLTCNDANPCTDDACYGSVGCTFVPTAKPGPVKCNDGDGCTHTLAADGTDCGNSSVCAKGICKAK